MKAGLNVRMTPDQHWDLRTAAYLSHRSMTSIMIAGMLREAHRELAAAGVEPRTAPAEEAVDE